jgi:hypothetical protein
MGPINTHISNVTYSTPYVAHKSQGYMRWTADQGELKDVTQETQ